MSNRAVVAVVVRQFMIVKRIALDLAVNGRAMTAKLTCHLVYWNFRRHQVMQAGDRRGRSAYSKGTCQNLQSEAIEITGMSHSKIECTRVSVKDYVILFMELQSFLVLSSLLQVASERTAQANKAARMV